jgi:hypothetical protein
MNVERAVQCTVLPVADEAPANESVAKPAKPALESEVPAPVATPAAYTFDNAPEIPTNPTDNTATIAMVMIILYIKTYTNFLNLKII